MTTEQEKPRDVPEWLDKLQIVLGRAHVVPSTEGMKICIFNLSRVDGASSQLTVTEIKGEAGLRVLVQSGSEAAKANNTKEKEGYPILFFDSNVTKIEADEDSGTVAFSSYDQGEDEPKSVLTVEKTGRYTVSGRL